MSGNWTVSIDSAPASVKIHITTALLALPIVEHGIRRAKGPSDLGKTL